VRRSGRGGREQLAAETALNDFMIAEYKYEERKLDDALDYYRRALRRRPDHFLSLLRAGEVLHDLGRYEAAEAMFTGAVALSPDVPIAYRWRAMSCQAQGKLDLAQADITKMMELDAGGYVAYFSQALLLERKGNTAEALAMYDKALEINPRSFSSRHNRGAVYGNMGQLDKARADFTAVIDTLTPAMDLNPRDPHWVDSLVTARISRAITFARMTRREEGAP